LKSITQEWRVLGMFSAPAIEVCRCKTHCARHFPEFLVAGTAITLPLARRATPSPSSQDQSQAKPEP
jgi:hypothetical protein